jgi:predicted amidophosphoribosyltransferase
MWHFNGATDYMNEGERLALKELMEAGVVTIFKLKSCLKCGVDIPNSKKYCSTACKKLKEQEQRDADGDSEVTDVDD